jgi:hypothetical protein
LQLLKIRKYIENPRSPDNPELPPHCIMRQSIGSMSQEERLVLLESPLDVMENSNGFDLGEILKGVSEDACASQGRWKECLSL